MDTQEQGRINKAISGYDAAIRLDPQSALAYANRAAAYTFIGSDAEANEDIEQARILGSDAATLKESTDLIDQIKAQR